MEAEGKGLLLGDCKQTRLGSETAKPEDREEEKIGAGPQKKRTLLWLNFVAMV